MNLLVAVLDAPGQGRLFRAHTDQHWGRFAPVDSEGVRPGEFCGGRRIVCGGALRLRDRANGIQIFGSNGGLRVTDTGS